MSRPDGWAEKSVAASTNTKSLGQTMSFESLNFESLTASVGLLKINRPQAMNALNRLVINELRQFFGSLDKHPQMRCLILTGAGEKAFVAGADIKEMADYTQQQAREMAEVGQSLFQTIEDCRLPTIAAVNGFALGGGLELAMSCDFMIASKTAKFGLPEVSLGLIPGYGGTQRLSRYIGKSLARMVTLTGDVYSAEQGVAWGLFGLAVDPAELIPMCQKMAASIASRGPLAVGLAKQAINSGYDQTQSEGLRIEADLFSRTFVTSDHNEGIRAFIDRRPPQFKGV